MLLARLSGNEILHRYVDELVSRYSLVLAIYGRPHSSDCAVSEHRQLIAALPAGDTPRAVALMDDHIESVASSALLEQAAPRELDLATHADLLANMQLGLATCRIAERSPEACRASDYFDAATLGGADALGRPDLGRLAPGCRADIVVFDLGAPHQHQTIDPIPTLMLTGRGRDARTVVIDGRFAMEDRVIPGIDETAMTRDAQSQFDRLLARYPDRTWGHPPLDQIFPPSYPAWT